MLAAAGEDLTVRLWEVATGNERLPREASVRLQYAADWSPDGRTIATSDWHDAVQLWDAATGRPLRQFQGEQEGLGAVAFSPNGKLLASGGWRGNVRVWTTSSGALLRELRGHHGPVLRPTFSPDGKLWASASRDGTVILSDLATGAMVRRLETSDHFLGLVFSPDGRLLASKEGHQRRFRLWDVASGREVRRLKWPDDWVVSFTFSADGRMLASGSRDSTLRLWEVATGRERLTLELEGPEWLQSLRHSSDGRFLALGGKDGAVRLWDARAGEVRRTFKGDQGSVCALAFSPDGRKLLSLSDDKPPLIWDVSALSQEQPQQPVRLRPEDLPALWSQLAGADAAVAYRAMRTLWSSPETTVSYLRPRLHPVPAIPKERLGPLVAALDSDSFEEREKADHELAELGELAITALEPALKQDPSAEARRRMEKLLGRLRGTPSGERLRLLRSVEVLEYIGTPEAREVLQALAKGAAEARLTQEAKASMKRLERRRL